MLEFVTAGESHGKTLATIISGIPSGLQVDIDFIDQELKRRQSGYGRGGRMKIESDRVNVVSGVRFGKTLGSPITLLIENRDWSNWQEPMSVEAKEIPEERTKRITKPRPGHADLAGALKYNTKDIRDILERSSARETTARVAVGGISKLLLRHFEMEIASHTTAIGIVRLPGTCRYRFEDVTSVRESSDMRCIDPATERLMIEAVKSAHLAGDTLGGTFEVIARGVSPGLGSHVSWDRKLDGQLAQAIMSINAVKAVEIGAGVEGCQWPGSSFHDPIHYSQEERGFFRTSNHAGGIEGGMSNGCEIVVRGHVKPIPTLRKPLESVDIQSKAPFSAAYERSDTCVVPAAGVIAEAMVSIVLTRLFLEKFGGDSLAETQRNYEGYQRQLRDY